MSIARKLIPLETANVPFKIQVTVSNGTLFTLPIADYGALTPLFSVNWGDSSSSTVTSASDPNRIHTYTTGGTYTIEISGLMPSFKVGNNSSIRSLITGIIDFGQVGLRELNFHGCNNISSIPASGTMAIGYQGLSDMENFASFLRSTTITSIPSGLFDFAVNATTFSDCFSFLTGLTTIPNGLFTNNVNATTFSSCFSGCTALSSYPSNLFDTNINVTNFAATFRFCRSLTAPLQFTNNTNVLTFSSVYQMASTANSLTGNAPTLWLRTPTPLGTAAFRNCTGLTNFASIPSNWK